MNSRAIALVLACAAQLLAFAAPAAAQGARPGAAPLPADHIVAVVNAEPITNGEVRARMARYAQEMQERGQPLPPSREVFAKQVLERLISEKAQLQGAHDYGVKIDEAVVDQAEAQIARNNQVPVADLRRRIESQGMSVKQFRDDLRDQLTLQRLREREFESKG